ncbi:MAG: helix-turn-helix domain-containing protein [Conexibacter sp.]
MTPAAEEQLRALGEAVRRARRQQDLTQEAVAHAAGVHPNLVGRLERGAADVHTSTMLRIVAGTGVPLSEIARDYEKPTSRSGSSRKP